MNRRGLLYLLGGAAIGGGGIVTAQNGGDVDATISDFNNMTGGVLEGLAKTSEDSPMTQEFGFGSPGFEKIEFERVIASNFNGWLATITFGSHDMDGFGIRHSSLDSIEDDIYVCAAPKSTGTRDIPIVRVLKEDGAVYPDRTFNLMAYEGEFSDCGQSFQFNFSFETKGSATFTLPKKVAPASAFRDMTPTPEPSN